MIRHPRNNSLSPFLVTENKIYELLAADRRPSSFLFGRQVISNGKILIACEFHPLFLALSLIYERRSEFYSLEDFFNETDLKPVEYLIKPYFYLICKQTKISNYEVWACDEKKMLDWLCSKISKLISFLQEMRRKNNEKILSENEFAEQAFDILRHYLKASLSQMLKSELQKRYSGSFLSLNFRLDSDAQKQVKEKTDEIKPTPLNSSNNQPFTKSKKYSKETEPKKKKEPESKKKKDAKIPKHSIESFFSPQKKK